MLVRYFGFGDFVTPNPPLSYRREAALRKLRDEYPGFSDEYYLKYEQINKAYPELEVEVIDGEYRALNLAHGDSLIRANYGDVDLDCYVDDVFKLHKKDAITLTEKGHVTVTSLLTVPRTGVYVDGIFFCPTSPLSIFTRNDILPESDSKSRKKLKPLQREANEALLLIYELLKEYNISYLDELSGVKAWGLIVSGEFSSDSIDELPETPSGYLKFKDGYKCNKSDFCEKYRKRFESC
jgi:hypothetical protein